MRGKGSCGAEARVYVCVSVCVLSSEKGRQNLGLGPKEA